MNHVIFQAKMPQKYSFQPVKYDNILLFSVLYYYKILTVQLSTVLG